MFSRRDRVPSGLKVTARTGGWKADWIWTLAGKIGASGRITKRHNEGTVTWARRETEVVGAGLWPLCQAAGGAVLNAGPARFGGAGAL